MFISFSQVLVVGICVCFSVVAVVVQPLQNECLSCNYTAEIPHQSQRHVIIPKKDCVEYFRKCVTLMLIVADIYFETSCKHPHVVFHIISTES